MRILYFSRDYSSHDYRFLTALAQTGHSIGFLRLERGLHAQELRQLPPEINVLDWSGGGSAIKLTDGLSLLKDLKRIIKIYKPDLIQAGPIQRTAFMAAMTGFQPLVSMSWGYDLLIDAHRNAFWDLATRYTLKHSAALVNDCITTSNLAVSYGMNPEKIITFPWGIDLDHFTPGCQIMAPTPDENLRPFTLLSTRSWEPIYGVDVLARGFIKASKQNPNIHLVMLNNGSQSDQIQKILSPIRISHSAPNTSDRQMGPTVFLPGQIKYDELPDYYRSADLYIAATHSDGTSISLLEAMACGTPVLVSDIPGNREWVQTGRNGWLFLDGDEDALAAAILDAVNSHQKLAEMGHAARQIAEQRADWRSNFPKLMNAYEIALNLQPGALSP